MNILIVIYIKEIVMIENRFDDKKISNDDNIVINLMIEILERYVDRLNKYDIDKNIDKKIVMDYIYEIYYDDNIYIYIRNYEDILKDFLLYYIYKD